MFSFYNPEISEPDCILSESESNHAIKSLRLKEGDNIILLDGKGTIFNAQITFAHPKKCQVKINIKTFNPLVTPKIHIAIAPTKNMDRFEWFLEKATEIGVTEITPILCNKSERKQLKADRLENILVSAMKQSHQVYLPILNALTSFKDFIKQSESPQKFIAHCENDSSKNLLQTVTKKGINTTVLIGPEGDFSSQEIEMALSNGFTAVSLGNSRLRTETAGIVACTTLNQKL